jgi:hypothetical protein
VFSLTCSFGDELDGEASERTIDDRYVPNFFYFINEKYLVYERKV